MKAYWNISELLSRAVRHHDTTRFIQSKVVPRQCQQRIPDQPTLFSVS
jgi:hypothetical protein